MRFLLLFLLHSRLRVSRTGTGSIVRDPIFRISLALREEAHQQKKKQFFTFSHRIFYAVLILKVAQGTHKKRNFGFLKNYVSTNLSSSSKKTWGGPGGHYRILQDRNARECGTISSGVDLFDSFCVKLGQCGKKFLFFPQNLLIPGNYWKPVRIYNEKRGKGSRYFA